jgi:hypothetical protein
LDGYLDCSHTAGHSADVEREVEHDTEGPALEDRGGNSHRWKTWPVRPEAWSIAAAKQEGAIVLDMALPSGNAGHVTVDERC